MKQIKREQLSISSSTSDITSLGPTSESVEYKIQWQYEGSTNLLVVNTRKSSLSTSTFKINETLKFGLPRFTILTASATASYKWLLHSCHSYHFGSEHGLP